MLSAAAVAAPDADATPTPPAPVSTGAPANGALPPAVLAALQRANLPVTALAAVALPLADAAVPTLPGTASPRWPRAWGHQAQRSMQPGSTMKVVTSAVALDRLGPNLRGSTELRSAAPLLPDGTLQGDLVLKGGADPELGVAQFWALLLELQAAGVRQVTGDLVVDRTLWRPARADLGVPPFDDAPQWGYNVIPDALQLAHTLLPLRLASDDHSLQADTVPQLPGVKLVSRMTLNDERCAAFGSGWQAATVRREVKSTVIELQGTYPKNCTQRVDLQLLDRQELTEHLFGTLWRQLGGQWLGRAVEAASPPGTRLLARRQARPWGEVLRTVNKSSDNALSRMLFLNLGVSAMDSCAFH
jgi:serine-type D-Ala-D-Ala carboxypeptidase/endopeptidase (penicillin-binding protein 4)